MGAHQLRYQPLPCNRLDKHQTTLEEVMKNKSINIDHIKVAIIMGAIGAALAIAVRLAG
jgi:hypothetical protein